MHADQVRGLNLREIGGGFRKHHRAPSILSACHAIAKPSTMVQKMQNIKKLRGHRNAVYCGMIFTLHPFCLISGLWEFDTLFCYMCNLGIYTSLFISSD